MQAAVRAYQETSVENQRDQLVLDNLDYVRHILGKMAAHLPSGVDRENLESAGVLGLVEAAHRYDASRGVAFKTFAYPRIRGAILDELRRNCPMPQKTLQMIAIVQNARESLPPPVTPEAIARETELSIDEVEQCLEAMRLTRPATWNDALHEDRHDHHKRYDSPHSLAERTETMNMIAMCIEKLPEEERLVITLYYSEDLRMREIGQLLGLSESRVSRLLAKAEFRLKQLMKAKGGS
jgi:RNA polymerase sigma factor for flagellar operon FliA